MRPTTIALLSFVAATVLVLAAVAASGLLLPETVPTHFGAGGAADAWSTRTSAVTFLTIVSGGLVALFALLAWATPKMPWDWMNVPGKERWAELGRQDEVRRRLRSDILWLGTATALLNVAITLSVVDAARSGTDRLPTWFFLALGAWTVAIVGYAAASMVRYRTLAR